MLTFPALQWCTLPTKLCWAPELWGTVFSQAGHKKISVSGISTVLRVLLLFTNGRRILNAQFFLSPQSFVHWCSLLYSSSPWWLYSSRCPPRWGVLCAFVTRAPGRSPHRSQPGSFQPSPEQKMSSHRWIKQELPSDFKYYHWFLKHEAWWLVWAIFLGDKS